jgi:Major tropism determinant N-terminal domain
VKIVAVEQISRIQIRRGKKATLPDSLSEGEMAFTTDSGEVFIGAPDFSRVQQRSGSIYPYKNIRILTEFDVVRTMHDHIVTTGPLQRITATERDNNQAVSFTFQHTGDELDVDTNGDATTRIVNVSWNSSGSEPGDLRGRFIVSAKRTKSDTTITNIPSTAVSVIHQSGTSTNSLIMIDLDQANLNTILNSDIITVTFLKLDFVTEYQLNESDSFVMDYSMKSEELVNGLNVRRTGTLTIAADEYSVAILDNGIDLNQDPSSFNYMRVIWSGHTEDRGSDGVWIVLTLTNVSTYPVSITFAGTRWLHGTE